MPKVTIRPDDISFDATHEENILAIGLQQSLKLPHGCKDGLCGACKCKVISGEILLGKYNQMVLPDEEINQGYTLLCKAHALNDVELFIPELLNGFPIKILPAKIINIEKSNNIAIVKMKIPQTQKFGFFAGQYIDIIVNGKNRSYSIANACHGDGEIEIHVKYHLGGVFSEFVWNTLKKDDILRFRGPLGNFKLRKSANPVIFVCTGTGFAPIKSILEEYSKMNASREMYLYWGNREVNDFYLRQLLDIWCEKLNLKIKLCLSGENHRDFYSGYVTQHVRHDFSNLSNFEIYACGNLNMIEDIYELSTLELGLNRSQFYSDAFTPSV